MVFRILVSIALLFSSLAMSQGIDLQLNKIITLDTLISVEIDNGYHDFYSNNLIVPSGKAWKIEFAYPSDFNKKIINDGISPQITDSDSRTFSPFWLSEGDKIKFYNELHCPGSSCTKGYGYFLSILEFNTD